MNRVAIYARKSTDEKDKHDEAKSVTRQLEQARAFAVLKDWTVVAEFSDDARSGVLDESRRPGLRALLAAADTRSFDILVMAAGDRLSRDQWLQASLLMRLSKAKVRIWFYQDQREADLSGSVGKFLEAVRSFGSEFFRESARGHMIDALKRKAKAGHVHGGVTFGFTNVKKAGHVERVINEAEAAIIHRIFTLYAAGTSPGKIAKVLNEERIVGPAKSRGWMDGDWGKGLIRDILYRESYHGFMISHWNGEEVKVAAPHLRIIGDTLWTQTRRLLAHQRAIYLRRTNGRVYGRPAAGIESKYTLTGMLLCGVCGAAMTLRSSSGTGRRLFNYRCRSNISGRLRRNQRQLKQCKNTRPVPMLEADRTILGLIESTLLRPDIVAGAIAECVRRLDPARRLTERKALESERTRLTSQLRNLARAIAAGKTPGTILKGIEHREARVAEIEARLDRLATTDALTDIDVRNLEARLRQKLQDFQGLASRHVQQTRQILRLLIPGRLTMTPKTDHYEFRGEGVLTPLLTGIIPESQKVVTPAGFARSWSVELIRILRVKAA